MFLVCGEALFDVFTTEVVDQAAFEVPLSARVGGSPLNVAVGLARLGCPVAMLTGLSTDFLGERLLASLQSEGVNTGLIVRKQAPTTLGFVQQDAAGVPSYAFYGNGAADRLLTLDDINVDLEGTAVIHFGSYS
ncbi:MAG: carbohydrate kinase, partial [Thiothrix sp.]